MNLNEMLQGMSLAARQVGILYLLVAVGFIADKAGLYTESTALKCTDLLFYIVTPAKIVESFIALDRTPENIKSLFIAMGCGAVLHCIAVAISMVFFNRCPKEDASVYKYAVAYGNCGYMGLPLVNAIVGTEGVFFCSAVIISFQIFSFTHGVWVMNLGRKGENRAKFDAKKLVINPGVIGVAIGLPLFLAGLKLPVLVSSPIEYCASLNTPLAMIMFGTYMAHTDFRSIFRRPQILLVAFGKLLLLPCIMMCVLKLFGLTGALFTTLVICAAAPPANNTVMFSAKYGRSTGLASQVVSVVSLMSIFTIPLLIGISGAI